ncbi:MAG: hypothetical protein K6B13_08400, partial [Prevotella sp.]|nr:hypothetical protein [Prevotella sp.]
MKKKKSNGQQKKAEKICPFQQLFIPLSHRMASPSGLACVHIDKGRLLASVQSEHKLRKSNNRDGQSNEASAQQASCRDACPWR